MRRGWMVLELSALLALLALPAWGAEPAMNPYLAQARVFFQGMEFEKCLQRIERAGSWPRNETAELVEIEVYAGLCSFSLGRRDEAAEHFKLALELDPATTLPPTISPRIREQFDELAASRRARPAVAGTTTTEAENAVADHIPTPPITSASSPSPATEGLAAVSGAPASDAPRQLWLDGPAQSGVATEAFAPKSSTSLALPLTLGGGAVLAAGAGVVLGLMARADEARVKDRATFYDDARVLRQRAQTEATAANVCLAAAGSLLVSSVLTYLIF